MSLAQARALFGKRPKKHVQDVLAENIIHQKLFLMNVYQLQHIG